MTIYRLSMHHWKIASSVRLKTFNVLERTTVKCFVCVCVCVCVCMCMCVYKNVVADHVMLRGTRSRTTMRGHIMPGLWMTFCDRMVLNDLCGRQCLRTSCIEHLWDILGRAINKALTSRHDWQTCRDFFSRNRL